MLDDATSTLDEYTTTDLQLAAFLRQRGKLNGKLRQTGALRRDRIVTFYFESDQPGLIAGLIKEWSNEATPERAYWEALRAQRDLIFRGL